MFGWNKRLKDLEVYLSVTNKNLAYRCDKLQSQLNCQKGKHEYELKNVGVGEGVTRWGEFGSSWTHYDKYRPAKVCKYCDDTINLKEEKDHVQ